jgi:hypothetical protein
VARLQQAVSEGHLDLDEFGQRGEVAYAAVATADFERLLAGPGAIPPGRLP